MSEADVHFSPCCSAAVGPLPQEAGCFPQAGLASYSLSSPPTPAKGPLLRCSGRKSEGVRATAGTAVPSTGTITPWPKRGDLQEAVTRDSALSSLSLPATDLSLSSSVGSWTSVMHQSLSRRRTENTAPMPVLKQQGEEAQTSHQCTVIFRAWQCNTRTYLPGRCLQVSEEMHLAEDGEIEQCL